MNNVKSVEVKPNSNYKDKYAHLIGQDAAVEAAKKTETNKSYGFGENRMTIIIVDGRVVNHKYLLKFVVFPQFRVKINEICVQLRMYKPT